MSDASEEALGWRVVAQEGEARAGILRTRRGVIETPVFMPVGTLGTVKGVRFDELEAEDLDARIILGNTYHLWLRPGPEVIRACGGLHRFTGWRRALLTDSGGFQVFSLADMRRVARRALVKRHHDLRAERGLHLHGDFRREKAQLSVNMRAKLRPLFRNLAERAQAPDLKAA